MKRVPCFAYLRSPLSGLAVSGLAFVALWAAVPRIACAQNAPNIDPAQSTDWAAAAIAHAQGMRRFKDADRGSQPTPPIIPQLEVDEDSSGLVGTFQPGMATITAHNAFFQNLGRNGRTCFTCHQPQTGWTISAASASARFDASAGQDPLFRLVDGATCPSDDVSTLDAKRQAYSLLINKALIRIGIKLPPAPKLEFAVTAVQDPYNCTTNPVTGLTSPTTGIVSMYRRPLPTTHHRL